MRKAATATSWPRPSSSSRTTSARCAPSASRRPSTSTAAAFRRPEPSGRSRQTSSSSPSASQDPRPANSTISSSCRPPIAATSSATPTTPRRRRGCSSPVMPGAASRSSSGRSLKAALRHPPSTGTLKARPCCPPRSPRRRTRSPSEPPEPDAPPGARRPPPSAAARNTGSKPHMRRAKIVATLGPATSSYEQIRAIVDAGVDVARMNLSHGTYDVHEGVYQNVRKAANDSGRAVAVLVDLQGPKIRLGKFEGGPYELAEGDIFKITTDDIVGNREIVGTTFKGLPNDVKPGDFLLIDDGKVRVRVTESTATTVTTEVVVAGAVSNNKGINLPGVAVNVPALSEKDEADLRWGLRIGAGFIALSFVRNASDVVRVHEIMAEEGRRVPVIAKIEKPQAVDALEGIVDAFDAIMVARGDLGVELPLEAVPIVQKH